MHQLKVKRNEKNQLKRVRVNLLKSSKKRLILIQILKMNAKILSKNRTKEKIRQNDQDKGQTIVAAALIPVINADADKYPLIAIPRRKSRQKSQIRFTNQSSKSFKKNKKVLPDHLHQSVDPDPRNDDLDPQNDVPEPLKEGQLRQSVKMIDDKIVALVQAPVHLQIRLALVEIVKNRQ